jgi:hypothetical protein
MQNPRIVQFDQPPAAVSESPPQMVSQSRVFTERARDLHVSAEVSIAGPTCRWSSGSWNIDELCDRVARLVWRQVCIPQRHRQTPVAQQFPDRV